MTLGQLRKLIKDNQPSWLSSGKSPALLNLEEYIAGYPDTEDYTEIEDDNLLKLIPIILNYRIDPLIDKIKIDLFPAATDTFFRILSLLKKHDALTIINLDLLLGMAEEKLEPFSKLLQSSNALSLEMINDFFFRYHQVKTNTKNTCLRINFLVKNLIQHTLLTSENLSLALEYCPAFEHLFSDLNASKTSPEHGYVSTRINLLIWVKSQPLIPQLNPSVFEKIIKFNFMYIKHFEALKKELSAFPEKARDASSIFFSFCLNDSLSILGRKVAILSYLKDTCQFDWQVTFFNLMKNKDRQPFLLNIFNKIIEEKIALTSDNFRSMERLRDEALQAVVSKTGSEIISLLEQIRKAIAFPLYSLFQAAEKPTVLLEEYVAYVDTYKLIKN